MCRLRWEHCGSSRVSGGVLPRSGYSAGQVVIRVVNRAVTSWWWRTTGTIPPNCAPRSTQHAQAGRTGAWLWHRFGRTRDLFDDLAEVLSAADAVALTDVYAAGEAPIDGVDSRALCQSIRARGQVEPVLISEVEELPQQLPSMLRAGDLLLLLGAGSIGQVAQQIRESGLRREAA